MTESQKDDFINYSKGVNQALKQTRIFQSEFYLTWTKFEKWTVFDTVCNLQLLTFFMSSDWFYEHLRERLTEIYDKKLVDEMLPYDPAKYFPFNSTANIETIQDVDLKKSGQFVENGAEKLYEIDEDLLDLREKADSIDVDLLSEKSGLHIDNVNSGGSNCWSIHGNHTQSGKPLLACDPHLSKLVFSQWYPLSISWKVRGERASIIGGSLVGLPLFTHGQSDYAVWGLTALNPDTMDLFTETVENG